MDRGHFIAWRYRARECPNSLGLIDIMEKRGISGHSLKWRFEGEQWHPAMVPDVLEEVMVISGLPLEPWYIIMEYHDARKNFGFGGGVDFWRVPHLSTYWEDNSRECWCTKGRKRKEPEKTHYIMDRGGNYPDTTREVRIKTGK